MSPSCILAGPRPPGRTNKPRPSRCSGWHRHPLGLTENLTLYLSRYLHLVVDLQLESASDEHGHQTRTSRTAWRRSTVGELLDGMGTQPGQLPAYYRIQENRILKNGELRYYDHPKFGVLAKVTRVEDEEEDSGADRVTRLRFRVARPENPLQCVYRSPHRQQQLRKSP